MRTSASGRFGAAVLVAVIMSVLLVASFAGTAAAQESRTGGTVVVAENETENGLSAFAGTVVVRGTVDGDLEAFAGNLEIAETATVTGDVEAFAGNVRIEGVVDGTVETAAGNVYVGPDATIRGDVEAVGGRIDIAGNLTRNATLGGGTIVLRDSAVIGGNVTYSADSFDPGGATIVGSVDEDPSLDFGPVPMLPSIPGWTLGIYGLLVELLLGGIALAIFPRFTGDVADRAAERPLYAGAIGFVALLGIPVSLVVLAITIVGIPLAILGAFAFALLVWIAIVLGKYAVGSWLLSLGDLDNRWAALLVGLVAVWIVGRVPILGGLIELLVALLGLGALSVAAMDEYRGGDGSAEPVESTHDDRGEEPSTTGA